MPETFDARFPVSVNSLKWAVRLHLSSDLSKFNCLATKTCHVWTHFEHFFPTVSLLVGLIVDVAGRDSCRLQEVVGCLYTDIAKTSMSNFLRVWTAFSGELPKAGTVLLVGSYSGQIFPRRNVLTRRRLHVISLAMRDRQWNELAAKFKITWPHFNQPIRCRP